MKTNFRFLIVLLVVLVAGCEEDNTIEQTSPEGIVLTDPGIGILTISPENLSNQAGSITWTDNTNSGGTYEIELATDDLFQNTTSLGTTDTNTFSFTQAQLNNAMASLNGNPLVENAMSLRVSSASENSNTISFVVVPIVSESPILQSPAGGESYTLLPENAGNEAFAASWMFTDNNNINISYDIQVALADTNFSPLQTVASVDNDNMVSIITTDLNDAALALGVQPEGTEDLDLRLKISYAYSNGSIIEDYSDVVTVSVTTYNPVFPYLYFVGDATTPGWNNNNNNTALFRSQDTPNAYHFTGYFNAGAFKILETLGQWQPQWGTNDGATLEVNPGGGSDPGTFNVGAAGYYTFTANSMVSGGSYTFEAFDASAASTYTTMGLIGDATPNGWDGSNDTNFTQDPNNPHLWYINGVTLTNGGQFLIRANDVWPQDPNAAVWRYTGSQELFGTANLDNGGGDNFPFNGDTGSYDVWFNDLDGSYAIIAN